MNTRPQRAFVILVAFCVLLLLACDLSSLAGNAATKPTVTITAPASGARVGAGTQVAVQVFAADARGIAWLELWVDGVVAGNQILPAPQTNYSAILPWRATTPGAHVFQVKAYNTAGAVSDPVLISIEVVPAIAQATPPAPPAAPLASPTPTRAQVTGEPTSATTKIPTKGPYPTPAVTPLATKLPPADLPFHIDCSALDPSKQAACDIYIAASRDTIYPMLRDITGVSLSSCYDAIYYTIVPNEQLPGLIGRAEGNKIWYVPGGSVNNTVDPRYEVHELLHTIGFCSGALDGHIFHDTIYGHINWTLTGYYLNAERAQVVNYMETVILPGAKQSGGATEKLCSSAFGALVHILYYDSGIDSIKRLYRATLKRDPAVVPNAKLSDLFGAKAWQYQMVVNALKQNPKYTTTVPECGY